MQQVSQIIKKLDDNRPLESEILSLSETSQQLPMHWQTALFDRFKAIYDNKFTDKYTTNDELEAAQNEWGEALIELSGAQIKRGIEACRVSNAWPPSIAEFIELAKGGSDNGWEHKGEAYRLHQRALPKSVNRTAGRAALKGLRAAL